MKKTYLIYTIWLILVIIWNFAFPNVSPLNDVIAAVVLSTMVSILKKII
tara:strand:- start:1173 stop:1319 length:147 start_codon:yes stop_codon:yes gene_type:complete